MFPCSHENISFLQNGKEARKESCLHKWRLQYSCILLMLGNTLGWCFSLRRMNFNRNLPYNIAAQTMENTPMLMGISSHLQKCIKKTFFFLSFTST
jgi:hypothetical protein